MTINEPKWWVDEQMRRLAIPCSVVPWSNFNDQDPTFEATPIYNRLRALRGNTSTFERFDSTYPGTKRL